MKQSQLFHGDEMTGGVGNRWFECFSVDQKIALVRIECIIEVYQTAAVMKDSIEA